jgi:replication initiation protein RepC
MNTVRPESPAIRAAIEYAYRYDVEGKTPRSQVLKNLYDIATATQLTPAATTILRQMIDLTQPSDWQAPARPVCWPSNQWLADTCRVSRATLKRSLNQLINAGLIAPWNAANGHRFGYRRFDGTVDLDRTSGFDLAPISVRFDGLLDLAIQRRSMIRQVNTIRDYASRLLAEIGKIIDSVETGIAEQFGNQLTAILDTLGSPHRSKNLEGDQIRLSRLKDALAELRDSILMIIKKMIPQGAHSELDYNTNTTMNKEESCSILLTAANAAELKNRTGIRKKRGEEFPSKQDTSELYDQNQLPLDLIKAGCPSLQLYAGEAISCWSVAHKALARAMKQFPGLERAYEDAKSAMGEKTAAGALAIIVEKAHRIDPETDEPVVKEPGAYLRGMLAQSRRGNLNLARSLQGLSRFRFNPLPAPCSRYEAQRTLQEAQQGLSLWIGLDNRTALEGKPVLMLSRPSYGAVT